MTSSVSNLAQAMTGQEPAKNTDIPIDHLDYGYVNKCSNGKELEKILKTLRSGKEGRWPDLEAHCERKLASVFPKSKLLRITTNLIKRGALDEETRDSVDQDINDWLGQMSKTDSSLKDNKNIASVPLPGVRTNSHIDSNRGESEGNKGQKKNPDKINSYDYRSWDKYNPDRECEKIDEASQKMPVKAEPRQVPKTTVNPQVLCDTGSAARAAEGEKNKGNEAFKAGDYQESINYYTNSIDIHPTAATFNNRGLAEIRLERYYKAIEDFDTVLGQEPDNVKALLRRSDAREKIGLIKEAHADLQRSVIVDENNTRPKHLLEEFTSRNQKFLTKGGKRMKIVESSSDEEADCPHSSPSPVKSPVKVPEDPPCSRNSQSCPASSQPDKGSPVTCTRPTDQSGSRDSGEANPSSSPSSSPPSSYPPSSSPPSSSPPSSSTDLPTTPSSSTDPTTPPQQEAPKRQIITTLPLSEKVAANKAEATALFSGGRYGEALAKYTECIEGLDRKNTGHWQHLAVLTSNRAACKLKVGESVGCVKDCNESLTYNPRFFKSVLRRAIGYEQLENHKRAYQDYRTSVLVDHSQITAQQGSHRMGEILKQKYGSSWRNQVSSSLSLPDGPDFVPVGSALPTTNGQKVSSPARKTSREVKPIIEEPAKAPVVRKEAEKVHPPKAEKETPKPQPTEADKEKPKTQPPKAQQAKAKSQTPVAKQEKPKPQSPKAEPAKAKLTKTEPKKDGGVTRTGFTMPTREEQYAKFKEQGNASVAKQEYGEALKSYGKCITLNKDLAPAHLNSALCHLKLGNLDKCVECTDMVLALEPDNIKALYRRASANKALKNYPAAAKDLKFIAEKDASNKPALQLLHQVKTLWNNQLRGMQGPAPKASRPASQPAPQPKKTGKKVPIVVESSESDSEEDDIPARVPEKREPAKKQQPSPPKPKEPVVEPARSSSGNKPWLKKQPVPQTASSDSPTAFSFLQHWTSYKKRKDLEQFGRVLESCEPASFPKLFASSMDADMVTAIVNAVDKYFVPRDQHSRAIEILQAVTKVQRFDVMMMLISSKDKKTITAVLDKLEGDESTIKNLHKKFT